MPGVVKDMRMLQRGFEGTVRLGVEGPPGASVQMVVVLSSIDPEWVALRKQVEDLFRRRAESALSTVVEAAQARELQQAEKVAS